MISWRIVSVLLILSLGGCFGRPAQLLPVGSHTMLATDQLEADWPQGWMSLRPAEKDEEATKQGVLFVVTRDGFTLQSMRLAQRPLEGSSNIRKRNCLPECYLRRQRQFSSTISGPTRASSISRSSKMDRRPWLALRGSNSTTPIGASRDCSGNLSPTAVLIGACLRH